MKQQKSSMLLFLSRYGISQKDKGQLKQNKNHMIMEKENEEKYISYIKDDSGQPLSFWGNQTNDAPVKFLLELAKRNGEPIDKIFCIVSKEVFYEKLPSIPEYYNPKTAFERFSKVVEKINKNIEIVPICYDFKLNSGFSADNIESEKMASHIYHQIENNITGKSIYIDYTGGLRDSSLFMIAIIRYLEFRGIICKDIVYSNFYSTPKSIHNIRYIYDMFEMINGVSEFVGSGNARQLLVLQEKLKNQNDVKEMDNSVKNFIDRIQEFSNAISICKIDAIESSSIGIAKAIDDLERYKSEDIFVNMFKTLIPTVKEKLYIGENGVSILDLVQWCLDNNMLQQAVTIYNERILSYYHDHYIEFRDILHYFSGRDGSDCECKKDTASKMRIKFNRNVYKKIIIERIKEEIGKNKIDFFNVRNFIKEVEQILESKLEKPFQSLSQMSSEYTNASIPNGKITQKDMVGFLTALSKGDLSTTIYLADKIKNPIEEDEITILKQLKKKNNHISKDLFQLMKYYHVIRIIRNSINHVIDETSNKEKDIDLYLKREGLWDNKTKSIRKFKFELTQEFISKTLQAAISYSKEVCN